jgi:hypothetical protein
MPKKRLSNTESVFRRMHIYCEGKKTEPNYIRSYIQDRFGDRLRDVVIVENAKTNTPIQLVKEAIRGKESGAHPEGDTYWAVYDRESPAKYKDSLHDEAYYLAAQNGINISLTSVCFEYWLILHFVQSNAPYSCYDDLISKSCLKDKFKALTGQKYEKGSSSIYRLVSKDVEEAKKRAIRINTQTLAAAPANVRRPHLMNPYTDMPKLLDAIDNFAP